jgi:hypothetical protein
METTNEAFAQAQELSDALALQLETEFAKLEGEITEWATADVVAKEYSALQYEAKLDLRAKKMITFIEWLWRFDLNRQTILTFLFVWRMKVFKHQNDELLDLVCEVMEASKTVCKITPLVSKMRQVVSVRQAVSCWKDNMKADRTAWPPRNEVDYDKLRDAIFELDKALFFANTCVDERQTTTRMTDAAGLRRMGILSQHLASSESDDSLQTQANNSEAKHDCVEHHAVIPIYGKCTQWEMYSMAEDAQTVFGAPKTVVDSAAKVPPRQLYRASVRSRRICRVVASVAFAYILLILMSMAAPTLAPEQLTAIQELVLEPATQSWMIKHAYVNTTPSFMQCDEQQLVCPYEPVTPADHFIPLTPSFMQCDEQQLVCPYEPVKTADHVIRLTPTFMQCFGEQQLVCLYEPVTPADHEELGVVYKNQSLGHQQPEPFQQDFGFPLEPMPVLPNFTVNYGTVYVVVQYPKEAAASFASPLKFEYVTNRFNLAMQGIDRKYEHSNSTSAC